MYKLITYAYCGMAGIPDSFDGRADARLAAARMLKRRRMQGFPVTTLESGKEWEVLEPDGCVMVPDACGSIVLRHVTFACRECGCACETRDEAAECCAYNDSHYNAEDY